MKPFNYHKIARLHKFAFVLKLLSYFFRKPQKNNNVNIKNILVLDAHLIGDLIILTPLISLLKKKYPSAKLTLMAGPWCLPIYKNFSEIDDFVFCELPWVKYDKRLYRYYKLFELVKNLKKTNYDICIEVRGDLRNQMFLKFAKQTNIVSFSFFDMPYFIDDIVFNDSKNIHLSDYNKAICTHLGLMDKNDTYIPFLKISNEEKSLIKNCDQHIGIHFGASQPLRRPDKRLLDLWLTQIYMLNKYDYFVVYETPEDKSISEYIYSILKRKNANVQYWKGSLRDFIVHLNNCKYLYCLDSAPAHIAAALNIPSTVIFGPMFSEFTRPVSVITKIVNGNELACKSNCDQVNCTNPSNRACYPLQIC